MRIKYEPSPDFVSKTMKRIYTYETSKHSFFKRGGIHELLQRFILASGGALFGILHATHVF
jgi:hypothetical protein